MKKLVLLSVAVLSLPLAAQQRAALPPASGTTVGTKKM